MYSRRDVPEVRSWFPSALRTSSIRFSSKLESLVVTSRGVLAWYRNNTCAGREGKCSMIAGASDVLCKFRIETACGGVAALSESESSATGDGIAG